MDSLCICYNIVTHNFVDIPPLPEAFIVSKKGTHLGYIEKQALPETLDSVGIQHQETPHQELLDICRSLKASELATRFQPIKKRKQLTLQELLKDKKIKEVIQNFVSLKMDTFYTLISKNDYPISYNAERKDQIESYRIPYSSIPLEPILTFTKTSEGIEYSFSIKRNEKLLIPREHNIKIMLNEPAWIILNKKLYQIPNLNANRLKPFFTKDLVTIPEKHVKTYVEKIILPVIKNIEVKTLGFEITTYKTITGYTLEVIHDFVQDIYVGKVIFAYGDITFDYNSKKTTASDVSFNPDGQIQITQTKRDPNAEKKIIALLTNKGLLLNSTLLLETSNIKDSYAILEWYSKHKQELQEEGFNAIIPQINTQKILTETATVNIENKQENDWFDIKGTVTIGDKKIPFTRFIKNIKKNNRFFSIDKDTVFIIPLSWMTRYKKLSDFGKIKNESIAISKSNYTILQDIVSPTEIVLETKDIVPYTTPSKLKATLRPYQEEGVQWLVKHHNTKLGACLADDMGLGKTLQTIAVLAFVKEQLTPIDNETEKIRLELFDSPLEVKTYLKALIVLPSSLVFNWAQEILKFAPHFSVVKYVGANRKSITPYLETYDIVLTTYATASKDISELEKIEFNYLIIDESQQIKNKESKLFKAINSINALHKISLSGTPIENSLADLWSQMEFINPGVLGSYSFFKDHFKVPIEKNKNEERIEELKTLIDPFILRRTKEQVAKDLPKLTEQIIYTEMLPKQEKQYESEKSAARNLLLGIDDIVTNKIHIINTLTKLRQLANHPKLVAPESTNPSGKFADITNYLTTLIKANKKVLIFSSFVSHLKIYTDWCDTQQTPYVTLTGKTEANAREQVVKSFQENDEILLFFVSLKAGGVGLNLTKASYVVLLDPWWNPFIEKQAIARAHRIGQTQNVMVTRFITKNTIEEKIIQLQNKKKMLSDDIIASDNIPDYLEEEIATMLE